jgi:hypothetical protein
MHFSTAANGSEHVTGTIAPTGVTLTDGTTSTVYRLAGAMWFGGNINPSTGQSEFTDTGDFNILGRREDPSEPSEPSITWGRTGAPSRSTSGTAKNRRTNAERRGRGGTRNR